MSVEESVKRREEGAVGSFCCLWLKTESKADRGVGPLGRGGQAEGGLHFEKLDLGTAKDCRAGGELEMGIRKRADSYKGVMTSVLNRHKKLHVSWVLPLRKAAVIIVNDDEGFNCIDGGVCVFK